VLTVDQLSKALNVSTKTISRWRRCGLVGFRFVCDGRPRVGFLQSSVDRFVRQNPQRVFRGAEFSRMAEDERQHILDEARRLARAGGSPSDVTKRLAEKTGRSAETIRCLLRQFDGENPAEAIFPDHFGPPREETKQRIFRQYRRGDSIDELAERHCRTKSSIRRIVAEMRARRIRQLPLDYIANEAFAVERAEKAILAPTPAREGPVKKVRRPRDLPSYLASLYEVPLLSRDQERHLFRKMNYLKYKASELLERLDSARPGTRLMNRIEKLYEESVAIKNEIIRANLRLVVSLAKRYVSATQSLYDLISDGNVTLMRAVEKFDYARGNKFSTYATWAMIKNYARSVADDSRRRQRFRSGYEEMLLDTQDERSDEDWQEAAQLQRENQVKQILCRLDPREQKVIAHRFGLARGQEPLTLKEVGSLLGVSKERARQIETRAMSKLRDAVSEEQNGVC
jgi:RNA polymerase primary sigma factor/RNA polymerase sigma factor